MPNPSVSARNAIRTGSLREWLEVAVEEVRERQLQRVRRTEDERDDADVEDRKRRHGRNEMEPPLETLGQVRAARPAGAQAARSRTRARRTATSARHRPSRWSRRLRPHRWWSRDPESEREDPAGEWPSWPLTRQRTVYAEPRVSPETGDHHPIAGGRSRFARKYRPVGREDPIAMGEIATGSLKRSRISVGATSTDDWTSGVALSERDVPPRDAWRATARRDRSMSTTSRLASSRGTSRTVRRWVLHRGRRTAGGRGG